MKKLLLSLVSALTVCSMSAEGTTFTKVTSSAQLVDGAKYVILTNPKKVGKVQYGVFAMGEAKSSGFKTVEIAADVTSMENTYAIDETLVTTFTLSASGSDWNLVAGDKYIGGSEVKKLGLVAEASPASITTEDAKTVINYAVGPIRANHANGAGGVKGTVSINTYATGQNDVTLYVDATTLSQNPDAPKPAGLAWSKSEVDVNVDFIEEFEAPTLSNPNNLTVAYESSNAAVAEVDPASGVVALTGEEGSATISAVFAGNDAFKAQTVSYTINVKSQPSATSVKETIALANNTEFTVNYELTVGFVFNKNIFVCDAAGDFIQIFGTNEYKVGDKIPAGWTGKYTLYNGVTPEIMPVDALPAATEGTFTPKAVAATDINNSLVNNVVTIKDVVFAEATPATKTNFTGKVGETELSFRNNYEKPGVAAGTYDVTVVVTLFKASGATEYTPSLYIVEYKSQSGETPDPILPEETKVTSLAEAFALATGTDVTVDCELTVGYVHVYENGNGKNIFVCDAAGDFIQIYGENTYKVGDKIPAGWKATYSVRYGAPQFTPAGKLPAATEGTFTPKTVAAADVTKDLVNHVIKVENIVLAEASPATKDNFTGKVDDVTLNLRNNYELESVEAGTYNITLVVNLYNGEPSLYVISFEKVGTSAIDEIEVSDAADTVYYNLNGVRVDNPENGIFIRVRGNKVDKVVK